MISLTFDSGPTPGVTDQVLTGLDVGGIRATSLLIGQTPATPDGSALARREQGALAARHDRRLNGTEPALVVDQ